MKRRHFLEKFAFKNVSGNYQFKGDVSPEMVYNFFNEIMEDKNKDLLKHKEVVREQELTIREYGTKLVKVANRVSNLRDLLVDAEERGEIKGRYFAIGEGGNIRITCDNCDGKGHPSCMVCKGSGFKTE